MGRLDGGGTGPPGAGALNSRDVPTQLHLQSCPLDRLAKRVLTRATDQPTGRLHKSRLGRPRPGDDEVLLVDADICGGAFANANIQF
jgi:hypothetical protein